MRTLVSGSRSSRRVTPGSIQRAVAGISCVSPTAPTGLVAEFRKELSARTSPKAISGSIPFSTAASEMVSARSSGTWYPSASYLPPSRCALALQDAPRPEGGHPRGARRGAHHHAIEHRQRARPRPAARPAPRRPARRPRRRAGAAPPAPAQQRTHPRALECSDSRSLGFCADCRCTDSPPVSWSRREHGRPEGARWSAHIDLGFASKDNAVSRCCQWTLTALDSFTESIICFPHHVLSGVRPGRADGRRPRGRRGATSPPNGGRPDRGGSRPGSRGRAPAPSAAPRSAAGRPPGCTTGGDRHQADSQDANETPPAAGWDALPGYTPPRGQIPCRACRGPAPSPQLVPTSEPRRRPPCDSCSSAPPTRFRYARRLLPDRGLRRGARPRAASSSRRLALRGRTTMERPGAAPGARPHPRATPSGGPPIRQFWLEEDLRFAGKLDSELAPAHAVRAERAGPPAAGGVGAASWATPSPAFAASRAATRTSASPGAGGPPERPAVRRHSPGRRSRASPFPTWNSRRPSAENPRRDTMQPKREVEFEGAFALDVPGGLGGGAGRGGGAQPRLRDGPGLLHLVAIPQPAGEMLDPAEELYAFLEDQGIELEEDEVEDVELAGGRRAGRLRVPGRGRRGGGARRARHLLDGGGGHRARRPRLRQLLLPRREEEAPSGRPCARSSPPSACAKSPERGGGAATDDLHPDRCAPHAPEARRRSARGEPPVALARDRVPRRAPRRPDAASCSSSPSPSPAPAPRSSAPCARTSAPTATSARAWWR